MITLTFLGNVTKINLEAKVASIRIPAVDGVSDLQLGAMKTAGTHNYHNAAVAALAVVGLDIGIDVKAINSTIAKLKVPPHRMQVGEFSYAESSKLFYLTTFISYPFGHLILVSFFHRNNPKALSFIKHFFRLFTKGLTKCIELFKDLLIFTYGSVDI